MYDPIISHHRLTRCDVDVYSLQVPQTRPTRTAEAPAVCSLSSSLVNIHRKMDPNSYRIFSIPISVHSQSLTAIFSPQLFLVNIFHCYNHARRSLRLIFKTSSPPLNVLR